jgi:hypothetical protein
MPWFDLFVKALPPSAMDRARQIAAAQRAAEEERRRREALKGKVRPGDAGIGSNPDTSIQRRPIGVRTTIGSTIAIGWHAGPWYTDTYDGTQDFHVISGDGSTGVAVEAMDVPENTFPAIPAIPGYTYASAFATGYGYRHGDQVVLPAGGTALVLVIYEAARMVARRVKNYDPDGGGAQIHISESIETPAVERALSFLVTPSIVRRITTPNSVVEKLKEWRGRLTLSDGPPLFGIDLPNYPLTYVAEWDGPGVPNSNIGAYGLFARYYDTPETVFYSTSNDITALGAPNIGNTEIDNGYIVGTPAALDLFLGTTSPDYMTEFVPGVGLQGQIRDHQEMRESLGATASWLPGKYVKPADASGLWSYNESGGFLQIGEMGAKESLLTASEIANVTGALTDVTGQWAEEVVRDRIVTVASEDFYLDGGINPSNRLEHYIAWDGGDPGYCVQKLLELGFSEVDITP